MQDNGKNVSSSLNDWCKTNKSTYLLDEWDWDKNGNTTPKSISYASNRKVWWLCPRKHSFASKVGNRTFLGRGCPYCSNTKVLEGFNDFKTWCENNHREELLEQWDYEKNALLPSQVTPHNGRKVWWRCSLGHEWDCTIGSRTNEARPGGCPYCSNPPKRILVGFNDFESWCKRNNKEYLLHEWDAERNGDITPKNITYGSGKRIWWKCDRGHKWCAPLSGRAQGTGCPVCSRTQTSFPEQAIAFYLSKSFNLLQRFRIKGYELDIYLEDYDIGIEYDGLFYHTEDSIPREQEKNEYYKKQGITLIHIKENREFVGCKGQTLFYIPEKSNYLDNNFNNMLLSLVSLIGSLAGIHIDNDIDVVRDELKIREHYASIIKSGSVAAVFPELVPEWDIKRNSGMLPENFSANAHTKVWWKCQNGHSWQADISSRARRLGCPYCAGQRTIIGENDLESWSKENAPELLSEWDYDKNTETPAEVSKTSNKKVWWKCAKGHEWEAIIANRVHGTRCPFCFTGNDAPQRGISLSRWCTTNHREQLLDEWNYDRNGSLTPENISKGSHKIVWWKCSAGHVWQAQVKSRTYNHGCPYCSGTNKKAVSGNNDLVTWCKENNKEYILDEWDYDSNGDISPDMCTFASHRRINWKCSKGHRWSAVIKERTKYMGNMCPECKKLNG